MIYLFAALLGMLCMLDAATHGELVRALALDPLRQREWWRLGSYGLVHAGFAHCAVNMVGLRLELKRARDAWATARWEPWSVLAAGVVVGGIASLAWTSATRRTDTTAGVSAGIFALWFTSSTRALVDKDPAAWTGVVILVLVSAGMTLIMPLDNAAHAGGALAGIVCGLSIPERKF